MICIRQNRGLTEVKNLCIIKLSFGGTLVYYYSILLRKVYPYVYSLQCITYVLLKDTLQILRKVQRKD